MTDLELARVDVHDEPTLRRWWEVCAEVSRERPHDLWPAWEVMRVSMPAHHPERESRLVLATADGEDVGAARLVLPLQDNPHLAFGEVSVRAAHEHRGHGRRLLADIEDQARASGRTTVLVEALTPPGEGGRNLDFGLAAGYAVANLEEIKVCDLAASAPSWTPLEAEVQAHLGDYRVRTWSGPTPAELVDGMCALLGGFHSQIPLGELELQDSEWTPERYRAMEAREEEIGRESRISAALAPDGTVVGFSNVDLDRADPTKASVGLTIVAPEHRGHRLGLALKLTGHRALMSAHPQCRLVQTSNAGVNAHMNAINEQMGYRVVETLHELQKSLRDEVAS